MEYKREQPAENESLHLTEAEKYAAAIELTEQAKECGDDPHQYEKAANFLKEAAALTKDSEASEAFETNYVEYCTEIAYYFMQDEKYHTAISFFRRLQTFVGFDAQMLFDMGVCYAQKGNLLQALREWKRAVVCIDEDNEDDQDLLRGIIENTQMIANRLGQAITIEAEVGSVDKAIRNVLDEERKARNRRGKSKE